MRQLREYAMKAEELSWRMDRHTLKGRGHMEAEECTGDLGALTKEASDLKNEIDDLEALAKTRGARLKEVRDVILKTLDLLELKDVRGHGFQFFRKTTTSVKTPKTPEEKKQLFDFLQERGIFLEIASVNSQTLNSLFKDLESEAMKSGNLNFTLPGVEKGEPQTILEMRRSK